MVVIAAIRKIRIEHFRAAAAWSYSVKTPSPVEQQIPAVSRPIWRFDVIRGVINEPTISRSRVWPGPLTIWPTERGPNS